MTGSSESGPHTSRRDDEVDEEASGRDLSSRKADDVDRYVSSRIKERRMALGLNQKSLAKEVGVSYQQAHKYENGLNRISAGRLSEIAHALGVEPSYFFEGYEAHLIESVPPKQRTMLQELLRDFSSLQNAHHQNALCKLARALAETSEKPDSIPADRV